MELIFAYIKKFGDFIHDQSIQFSNDFEVHLENKILTVREKKNYLKDFYGDGIKNISVLVGKNGSGKTTLLDILGMNRDDRLRGSVKKNEVDDEYLLLYYIGKNDYGQELFGIEVLGSNVFYDMFTNYDRGDDDDRYDKGKVSIGLVFRYENECFISMGKHFFNEMEENKEDRLSDLIRYAYINESYRYSQRNEHYGIYNPRYDDYIAGRKMYPLSNVYTKYLVICQCIEDNIEGFYFDKVKVKLYDEIDYEYPVWTDNNFKDTYKATINEIEEMLPLWKKINIFSNKKKKAEETNKREKYILDLYARYILDMLVNGLYSLCKEGERGRHSGDKARIDIVYHMEYILSLKSNESSYDKLGKPIDYEEELSRVIILISWLKEEYKQAKIFGLRILGRYVGSRIHGEEDNNDFGYVDILEKMTEEMFDIPEEYFQKDGIEFLVVKESNLYLKKFLKKYSEWEKIKKDWHSDIENQFKVHFGLLSEGEERFIDTITKIKDCVVEDKETKLLIAIMDEPDQAMHPEWARRFIDIMVKTLGKPEHECDIQLILSTHSPYLLSDILPSNVFLLERSGVERQLSVQRMDKMNGNSCFGANVYDLMKNQFFMENTVGEFATKKLNNLAREIEELGRDNEENIENIEYFVDQIGESVIQKILKKKLEDRKQRLKLLNNKNRILEMITNQDDKQRIKDYLEMLEDR